MRWITKKRASIALGCTCALAVAGVAFSARWLSDGDGGGHASYGNTDSKSTGNFTETVTVEKSTGTAYTPATLTADR